VKQVIVEHSTAAPLIPGTFRDEVRGLPTLETSRIQAASLEEETVRSGLDWLARAVEGSDTGRHLAYFSALAVALRFASRRRQGCDRREDQDNEK
jgi:hypothetical protein